MSRETDPDSDGYLCRHCGKAKTDHALTVHPVSGIVVAGAYTGPNTFTYCQGEDAAKALDRQGRRYRKQLAATEREIAELQTALAERNAGFVGTVERAPLYLPFDEGSAI